MWTAQGREWLIHSTRACTPGETIGMRIGPDEIHIMARSDGGDAAMMKIYDKKLAVPVSCMDDTVYRGAAVHRGRTTP